jgi:hypothetical protein
MQQTASQNSQSFSLLSRVVPVGLSGLEQQPQRLCLVLAGPHRYTGSWCWLQMPTGMSGWHLLPLEGRFLPVRRQVAMCPLPPFLLTLLAPLLPSLGIYGFIQHGAQTPPPISHFMSLLPLCTGYNPFVSSQSATSRLSSSTLGYHFPHPCHWQLLLMDELTKELPTLFLHLLTCSLNSPHHKADTSLTS